MEEAGAREGERSVVVQGSGNAHDAVDSLTHSGSADVNGSRITADDEFGPSCRAAGSGGLPGRRHDIVEWRIVECGIGFVTDGHGSSIRMRVGFDSDHESGISELHDRLSFPVR
jgi:hypothetical protein